MPSPAGYLSIVVLPCEPARVPVVGHVVVVPEGLRSEREAYELGCGLVDVVHGRARGYVASHLVWVPLDIAVIGVSLR